MDDCFSLLLNLFILWVVFMLGRGFGYKRAYKDGITACVNTIQAQGYDETFSQGYQAGLRDSISITVQTGGYEYNSTNTTTANISAILGSENDDDYARTVFEEALTDSMIEDKNSFGLVEAFQSIVILVLGLCLCACFFAFAVAEYDKAYPIKVKRDTHSDNDTDSDTWTKDTAMTTMTTQGQSSKTKKLLQAEGTNSPAFGTNVQKIGEEREENINAGSDVETASSGTADTLEGKTHIAPNTFQYIIQSDQL